MTSVIPYRVRFRRVGETARTLGCVLVTLVGVSGVLLRWAGRSDLAVLGLLFLCSPQPSVFADHNISGRVAFSLESAEGEERSSRADRGTLARLGGPLARKDAYVHALLGINAFPTSQWLPVLAYGLCERGPLARALGATFAVSQASLEIEFVSRTAWQPTKLRLECAKPPTVSYAW